MKKSKFLKTDSIINYTPIVGEMWANIDGFGYDVSSFGRVKSHYQEFINKGGWMQRFNPTLLSPVSNAEGYKKVSLSFELDNGGRKQKLFSVHRLVAIAFLPNLEGYKEINHIDGDKGNNVLKNLEWCNRKQNAVHASRMGLYNGPKGEKAHNAKLTKDKVLEIREIGRSKTLVEIGNMYGISFQTVSDIINRKKWIHI